MDNEVKDDYKLTVAHPDYEGDMKHYCRDNNYHFHNPISYAILTRNETREWFWHGKRIK